jgi:ribosomal protein S27E
MSSESLHTQTYFKSVRQLACPSCGGALNIVNRRTQYVSCQHCGSVLDVHTPEAQLIAKLEEPSQHPPRRFLRLGMQATIEGVRYQVVGRTRWAVLATERWEEDGEVGYDPERYSYDEWHLLSEFRSHFFIIESDEGFSVSENIYPNNPVLPEPRKPFTFFAGDTPRPMQAYGMAEVVYFEGEATYLLNKGDRAAFSYYIGPDRTTYLLEYRIENDQIVELEFFREKAVDTGKLAKVFEVDRLTANRHKRAQETTPVDTTLAWLMRLSWVFFGVAVMGFFPGLTEVVGPPLAQYTANLTQKNDTIAWVSPFFPVTRPEGWYQLSIQSTITDTAGAWLDSTQTTLAYSLYVLVQEANKPLRPLYNGLTVMPTTSASLTFHTSGSDSAHILLFGYPYQPDARAQYTLTVAPKKPYGQEGMFQVGMFVVALFNTFVYYFLSVPIRQWVYGSSD